MASASYREPRPHARSAAARQEKTRGRRRISRKAPDPSHDAVRTGAESDGRLHTGTTTPEGHSGPSMGKGQLWPFAQSSPPGSHKAFRGTVEDLERVGIQLGTGGDRLVPLEPYINRTRSSSPHGKNDQLLDNQPRRTRRLRPARLLLPSVSGTGGGMPDGIGPRLDGVWTRARNYAERQKKRAAQRVALVWLVRKGLRLKAKLCPDADAYHHEADNRISCPSAHFFASHMVKR